MIYRNIIFDLCGPLIKIDVNLINQALHQFGLPSAQGYDELHEAGLIKQYDRGLITPAEFAAEACKVWHYELPCDLLWEAWNKVVYDFDVRHVQTVMDLRKRGVKTFLLSNSDVVNAEYFCRYMDQRAGMAFSKLGFDQLFFSCTVHSRKPDVETFEKVLQLGGMRPDETLLIDDSRKNCLGAAKTGMQVHYLADDEEIEDVVKRDWFEVC